MFTLLVVYFMQDTVRYITDEPTRIISQLNLKAVSLIEVTRNH